MLIIHRSSVNRDPARGIKITILIHMEYNCTYCHFIYLSALNIGVLSSHGVQYTWVTRLAKPCNQSNVTYLTSTFSPLCYGRQLLIPPVSHTNFMPFLCHFGANFILNKQMCGKPLLLACLSEWLCFSRIIFQLFIFLNCHCGIGLHLVRWHCVGEITVMGCRL